jgi:hypothetical protein
MSIKKTLLIVSAILGILSVGGFAAANTFGGAGYIDDIDAASRTIWVGKHTLIVTSSSILLDERGNTLTFEELDSIDGSVSFTMKKQGQSWNLIRLVVEEPEEDE